MPPEENEAPVAATVVEGSQSEQINITHEEAKDTAPSDVPTPETFGVNQAQYDKYYNQQTGEYNWQAHAKEAEYIAGQRNEKAGEEAPPAEENLQAVEGFETPEDAVEKAGLDWDDLSYKIGLNGDIDAADYASLMQMGIPREIIETHVNVIKDQVTAHINKVTEAFGGKEAWQQTANWADTNMSEDEVNQLNQMLSGPNYQMAVDLLKAKAGTAMPSMPQSVGGQGAVQPYGSQMEMVADQRKPEYRKDPAFRENVMRRAAVSNWSDGAAHTAR